MLLFETSEATSVEGRTLSKIRIQEGKATGFSVLDDFLPWRGLPTSGVIVLEGPHAGRLIRKVISKDKESEKTIWIHSLKQRPFFYESQTCFRLQVPEDLDILKELPDLFESGIYSRIVVQLLQPLSRLRALEIYELSRRHQVPLVLICKFGKSFPSEWAELVIDTSDEYLSIRKAENRPVPMWIPVEMLDSTTGSDDPGVLSWWNALESFPG